MKRLNIVTGHYGSGKTEFAINLALRLKSEAGKSVICDMDIVNPYFRTNDAAVQLAESGVTLIAPEYANTNLDLPSLPCDILSVFSDKTTPAVLDVGGDEEGAIALGQYYPYLKDEDYEMYFVINALRPDTSDVEGITKLANEIMYSSRCRITAVVNNTNLSYLSSSKDIIDSITLVDDAAKALGVPVKFISGTSDNLAGLPSEYDGLKFPLNLFMQLPFDAFA